MILQSKSCTQAEGYRFWVLLSPINDCRMIIFDSQVKHLHISLKIVGSTDAHLKPRLGLLVSVPGSLLKQFFWKDSLDRPRHRFHDGCKLCCNYVALIIFHFTSYKHAAVFHLVRRRGLYGALMENLIPFMNLNSKVGWEWGWVTLLLDCTYSWCLCIRCMHVCVGGQNTQFEAGSIGPTIRRVNTIIY